MRLSNVYEQLGVLGAPVHPTAAAPDERLFDMLQQAKAKSPGGKRGAFAGSPSLAMSDAIFLDGAASVVLLIGRRVCTDVVRAPASARRMPLQEGCELGFGSEFLKASDRGACLGQFPWSTKVDTNADTFRGRAAAAATVATTRTTAR